jgi:alkylation response protein AidB-like acyl-CoA dehydrogenase
MGTGDRFDRHRIVEAVRDLGPAVAAASETIEELRRLPDELVEQLRQAGVFSMYAPRTVGGPEVHPLTAFAVAEELTRHDGSVGWCAQVAAAVTVFLAWIDPVGVTAMASESGSLHLAGSARPLGRAEVVEGGYRASGHWDYASGVRHANWFLGTCFVERPDGRVLPRSMFVPVSDGTIVANWNVMGMRGTGSDDFVLDDVFVPLERSAQRRWIEQCTAPLYDPRLNMVAAWAPTAGVGVGLAQGALDALVALGQQRTAGSPTALREREAVQEAAGRAATAVGAARAFVIDAIGAAWQAVVEERGPSGRVERAVAHAQLAITHTLNEAVRVADVAFHAAGTNAISTANRLERFLRDAHTAVQHSAGQPTHVRAGGRVVLGLDAGPLDAERDAPSTPRP